MPWRPGRARREASVVLAGSSFWRRSAGCSPICAFRTHTTLGAFRVPGGESARLLRTARLPHTGRSLEGGALHRSGDPRRGSHRAREAAWVRRIPSERPAFWYSPHRANPRRGLTAAHAGESQRQESPASSPTRVRIRAGDSHLLPGLRRTCFRPSPVLGVTPGALSTSRFGTNVSRRRGPPWVRPVQPDRGRDPSRQAYPGAAKTLPPDQEG